MCQRIDGGVGNGGGIGTGDVGSEGERRWIGHAASEQTTQVDEIHFQNPTGKDPDEKDRNDGYARAARSHCRPVMLKTVTKNFAPAFNPTAAKKSAIPNSRKARLVFTGMCQTGGECDPPGPE